MNQRTTNKTISLLFVRSIAIPLLILGLIGNPALSQAQDELNDDLQMDALLHLSTSSDTPIHHTASRGMFSSITMRLPIGAFSNKSAPEDIAIDFLFANENLFQFHPDSAWTVTSSRKISFSSILGHDTHVVKLAQKIQGLDVFLSEITLAFSAGGGIGFAQGGTTGGVRGA